MSEIFSFSHICCLHIQVCIVDYLLEYVRGAVLKILKIRKQRGLTQAELAERSGVSQQHIAKIERAKLDPKLSTLRRVADALGCEVRDLIWDRSDFVAVVNNVID